jgi:hypothetical protein
MPINNCSPFTVHALTICYRMQHKGNHTLFPQSLPMNNMELNNVSFFARIFQMKREDVTEIMVFFLPGYRILLWGRQHSPHSAVLPRDPAYQKTCIRCCYKTVDFATAVSQDGVLKESVIK